MKASEYEERINKFLPENSADIITKWMFEGKIHLRISKGRSTKLGDFRPPQHGNGYKISVNYNLNPYHFLIVIVHEYAHYLNWVEYGRNVKPHGSEWKEFFRNAMIEFFDRKVFPNDIDVALRTYLKNPVSSSNASKNLDRILKTYDLNHNEEQKHVEDFQTDDVFVLNNGKVFQMKEKKRTRYRCLCLNDGRDYAVSGMAEARLLSEEEKKKFSRGFLRSLFR